jgi:amidase
MDDAIGRLDATGQAALVARGEVSPRELLETAIAAADAADLGNAIPIRFDDVARERAASRLEGPFAGVPFLLKDLAQQFAGQPETRGAAPYRQRIAGAHSYFTRRCLDAGLVIFGRTATPELGLVAVTQSKLWGPARNPWDRERTPGGSSGGAAAVVAGGIVPMAGASDGGGSIRIPAGYCGLFGLKPSTGRISFGPQDGLHWEGASSNGVLSHSVRDSAAMLDVLVGPEAGDPFPQPRPSTPFAAEVGVPPGRLRIGYTTASPLGGAVDPACVKAVEDAARLLESLGHSVEPAAPRIDGRALAASYITLYLGQVAAEVAASGAKDSAFELETGVLAMLGRALPAGQYVTARLAWNGFARALAEFHATYDLYLLPTTAVPAPRIDGTALPAAQRRVLAVLSAMRAGRLMLKTGLLEKLAQDSLAPTPFTQLSNLTFTPSMSVPLAMTAASADQAALPIGVQFVGRFGEEATLIRLAAQLETAAPWADRRAPGI